VIGGGAAYVSTIDAADEIPPHQQLTLTYGPLALRSRVEERFFEDADRMELALAPAIGSTVPVSRRLQAGLAASCCTSRSRRIRDEAAHVDQWRANATLDTPAHAIARRNARLPARSSRHAPARPTRLSHVAQVTLTLRR
jgi:hypothetical protein